MNEIARPKLPATAKLEETFEYEAHALANLLPMMKEEEFANHKADIKSQGILQRITLYNDGSGLKILDGRNRYKAAKEVGLNFTAANFKTFTGTLVEAKPAFSQPTCIVVISRMPKSKT